MFKAVITYRQFSSTWHELFYLSADNFDQVAAHFGAGFVNVATAFRHASVYIRSVRISDLSLKRATRPLRYPIPTAVTTALTPDVVNTCAIWTLNSSSPPLSRKIWLRGLNDVDVVRNAITGQDAPSAALAGGVATYLGYMESHGFKIQALDPITGTSPYVFQRMASLTIGNGGVTTVNAINPVALTASGRVIISQTDPKLWPGLAGKYRAENSAGLTFGINYIARVPSGTYPLTRGVFRVEEYRYATVSAPICQFLDFASRDTNSSPFGGRGRRRAVSLRSR
jgi:hypothetical protein